MASVARLLDRWKGKSKYRFLNTRSSSSVVFRWSWRPAGAGAPTSSVRRTKEGWGRGRGRQRLEKRNKIIDISNQRASYWVCHPVSACHTKNYCRLGSFPRAVEVCRPAQAHETRGPFVHVPFRRSTSIPMLYERNSDCLLCTPWANLR